MLVWILLSTAAAGMLSVLAAAVIGLGVSRRFIAGLASYAVGVLLGAAFLDLIPHAAATYPRLPLRSVLAAVLAGILGCFVLETLMHRRYALASPSGRPAPPTIKPAGPMILIGGALHNFTDGILLAAAFLTDAELGVVTTLAVVAHEIPRELGDFGVLLHSGYTWRRAIGWNVFASAAALAGGLVGYAAFSVAQPALPYVIGVAAGSFVYIAIADLMPGLLARAGTDGPGILNTIVVAAGMATMAVAVHLLH